MPKQSVREQLRQLYAPETLMKIGARLHETPMAWNAAALGLRVVSQPRRHGQIQRYLEANPVRRLRLGAGRHVDEGWLSADLVPLAKDVIYLDAAKPLPIPDSSFDIILCEHMIEHVPLRGARSLLAECRRILRRGGVLRVATPDLDRLLHMTTDGSNEDDARFYIDTLNSAVPEIPEDDVDNPVYALNRQMHDWGHQFLYNERTLTTLLLGAGFTDIVRCSPNASTHADLTGMDRHHEETGERMNEIDTMILEAGIADE